MALAIAALPLRFIADPAYPTAAEWEGNGGFCWSEGRRPQFRLQCSQRPGTRPPASHEGPAGEARYNPRTIEPEGMLATAEAGEEGRFGIRQPGQLVKVKPIGALCGHHPWFGLVANGSAVSHEALSQRFPAQITKIEKELPAALRANGLRMELDAPAGSIPCFQGHDQPVTAASGNAQGRGKRFTDDQ